MCVTRYSWDEQSDLKGGLLEAFESDKEVIYAWELYSLAVLMHPLLLFI